MQDDPNAPRRAAFVPRSKQRPFLYAFKQELYRLYFLAWHRRFGKSIVIANAVTDKVEEKGWTAWHAFPKFVQARDAIWNGVDNRTGRRLLADILPYTSKVNDTRMILWFGDAFYQFIGMDNFDARVGAGPKVVIWDEFSLIKPQARNYMVPFLKENKGIEIFATTFRGGNHAAALADYCMAYPERAFYSELQVDQTFRDAPGEQDFGQPVVSQEEIEEERRMWRATNGKAGMSDEMIQQEFYLSREGVSTGHVYGKELREARKAGRIRRVPHSPELLVHTAWDRGVHNRIWFWQQRGKARSYIDYLSTDNSSLAAIVAMLHEEHRAKYQYGDQWVAADADQFNPWHELSGTQLAESLGIVFKIVPKLSVQAGIEQAKIQFAQSEFDADLCREGLEDLGEYEYEANQKYGSFSKEPNKRQLAAHGADAFRYSAIAELEPPKRREPTGRIVIPTDWTGV